ncbi:hypothetical protein ACFLUZ_06365, partial [Chloroflexota bacterium]
SVAGTIQAITISEQYTEGEETLRDIAIGTAVWNNNTTTGEVWVFQLGKSVPSWQDQSLTVDPSHEGGEVSAIAFSPNYRSDNTIIVIASTGSDVAADYQNKTWLCMGKRDTAAETTDWDYFSGYPAEIATASSPSAGDAAAVTRISSSLALPSDFSGSDEDSRQLFVSYDRVPDANDDVYRFADTTVYRLDANDGAGIDISSIAYYGTTTSGKLLTGDVSPVTGSPTVQVRRTSDPFDSTPTWHTASVPPSGPGNAKVSWSSDGNTAYCGTGQNLGAGDDLDESAFSMSSDDGANWQQLSLMDTTIKLSDIAPTPDSDTLFLATYSSLGPEGIWRSATTQLGIGEYWSRQMTMDTTSDKIILRLSPGYASDYTIYAVEVGGSQIAVSHNRGNSWKEHLTPEAVIDMVVEDEDTLYLALSGGYISKSTDGAFIWEESVYTGLSDINMLAVAEREMVLVGGRDGEVAYSTDGGASFTKINKVIGTGDVQVVADANYQENSIIYAATDASDKGIWRWTVGLSKSWEQIDTSITALETEQSVSGLAIGSEGTLYALRLEPASDSSGGMTRALNPADQYNTDVEFDFTSDALPADTKFDPTEVFDNTLPYIKLSGEAEQNVLWAIDTENELIYRFQDTLATKAPTLISPADESQHKMNQITGRAMDIAFNWNEPSNNVTEYQLGIYTDAACSHRVQSCPVESTSDTPPAVIIGPYQSSADNQFVEYTAGTTYYWRVKSTEPLESPWSETYSFTIEPIAALVPALLSPTNGATNASRTPSFSWEPVAGAGEYRFILADDVVLTTPIVEVKVRSAGYTLVKELELDEDKTYYWAVKAIAPAEGGWSTIANFTVQEKRVEPAIKVVVKEVPPTVINLPAPSPPPAEIVIPPSPPPSEPIVPTYVWAIIIVESMLVMVVIILIVRTRRPF